MILDTIAEATRLRVEKRKKYITIEDLKAKIFISGGVESFHKREAFAFEKNLRDKDITFICEVKKASPSKGVIAEEFPYLEIANEYEAAGASAISVLTEPEYFKGSNQYLSEISKEVSVPVLRKDFTIEEYQIYEAKLLGADAVLLICALLNPYKLKRFMKICDELGLSALVEAHTEEEVISALEAGARIIGVNNRNLKTFEVDIENSVRLRNLVPSDLIFVAESGIRTAEDIMKLRKAKVDAVLIGETLMKSTNKKECLLRMKGLME